VVKGIHNNNNENNVYEMSDLDDVYSNNYPQRIQFSSENNSFNIDNNNNEDNNNILSESLKERLKKRNEQIDKDFIMEENKDCNN
jgi:hypothetical protein